MATTLTLTWMLAAASCLPGQQVKLTPGDPTLGAAFGTAVDVSGNTAVVGAGMHDHAGQFSGSAYVFVHDGAGWSQQQELTANDAAAYKRFGWSVAVDGETAVIGSIARLANPPLPGSAYVFVRTGSMWTQEQKLLPGDTAPEDWFGASVAIEGDTIVVGAPKNDRVQAGAGAAYVFIRSGTTWTQRQKLTASDTGNFGLDVAMSADLMVVGDPLQSSAAVNSGAGYVYSRTGTSWSQEGMLTASDAPVGALLGDSVAISGETILLGSPFDDVTDSRSGSAYVFVRTGTSWTQEQKLIPGDGERFAESVALAGELAVVGSPSADSGTGAVYVFLREATLWTQRAKIYAFDAEEYDNFGFDVALSDHTALVGAILDDLIGSAYVLSLENVPAPVGVASCLGDACPCGNDDPAAGCANSTGNGGLLLGAGSTSASSDDLILIAHRLPPFNNGLFYMGDAVADSPFFDGRQCALGNTWRFLCCIQNSGMSGVMTLGPGIGADSGGLISAAETWHFQLWHRDVPGSPCGTGATLTNMLTVTFGP